MNKRVGIDYGGDNPIEVLMGVEKALKVNPELPIVLYMPTGGIAMVSCEVRTSDRPLKNAFYDLQKGELDILLTATNSRDLLGATKGFRDKTVPRPALLIPLPTRTNRGIAFMSDGGATNLVAGDDAPDIFVAWARVITRDIKTFLSINEDRDVPFGFLNNATEEIRLNKLLVPIHEALKRFENYVGLIEPADLTKTGRALFGLTGGYTGNISLKFFEEAAETCMKLAVGALQQIPSPGKFLEDKIIGDEETIERLYDILEEYPSPVNVLKEMFAEKMGYDAFLYSRLMGLLEDLDVRRIHGRCISDQVAMALIKACQE